MKATLERLDNAYHFRTTSETGQSIEMDLSEADGGTGAAPSPLQVVLMALGGCSSVDVVDILTKQRTPPETLGCDLSAKRRDEAPRIFTHAHVHFRLTGDLKPEKVRRAVVLSVEKYCSVALLMAPTTRVSASFEVNGERFDDVVAIGGAV